MIFFELRRAPGLDAEAAALVDVRRAVRDAGVPVREWAELWTQLRASMDIVEAARLALEIMLEWRPEPTTKIERAP